MRRLFRILTNGRLVAYFDCTNKKCVLKVHYKVHQKVHCKLKTIKASLFWESFPLVVIYDQKKDKD